MSPERRVSGGRVGRPHGRDGSFYVDAASHELEEGAEIELGGRARRIERRGGTATRPLVRVTGVNRREDAAALRGEPLLVAGLEAPPEEGEWLAEELVGCRVEGLGTVTRVLAGPSCDVLELDDGTLVPLISDAVRHVDPAARRIEVDRAFLGAES